MSPAVAHEAHAGQRVPARGPRFDRALVRKYDVPGPRYTSYPTAPCFGPGVGETEHRELLQATAADAGPLSLYVHLPFCPTRCLFCGCNVVVSRNPLRMSRYLDGVAAEAATTARLAGAPDRLVHQVHWGGGTPNALSPAGLARLAADLRTHFRWARDADFSVEIDPRHADDAVLDALAAVGVTRASVGVQDFEPAVQHAVRRVQPLEQTAAVVAGLRRRGIANVNVDLVYGLPHQTPASFRRTLGSVLALEPDRLAVFSFAYLPAMLPHQRALDRGSLPDAEAKLSILETVFEVLDAAGYVFIGMDHFARPGDPLATALAEGTLIRNFQGYATGGAMDLVGLGASAIGQLGGAYVQNVKDTAPYLERVLGGGLATERGLVPDAEDRLRREVIHDLMCRLRVDKRAVETRHGIDFDRHFATALARLAEAESDGLVEISPDELRVTALGRLLLRPLAMAFDARLPPDARFSRTV